MTATLGREKHSNNDHGNASSVLTSMFLRSSILRETASRTTQSHKNHNSLIQEEETVINQSIMADTEMNPEDFTFLKTLPGNDTCADCNRKKPDWGSPHLGIFFCFACSASHRCVATGESSFLTRVCSLTYLLTRHVSPQRTRNAYFLL
jgi:hypothetical protein